MTRTRAGTLLGAQLACGAGLLTLWEVLARTGLVDTFFFSRPSAILAGLLHAVARGTVYAAVAVTLFEASVGFTAGSLLGIALGILLARHAFVRELLDPFIYFFYSLPRIAVAPLFIVLLGLGVRSKVATVVFAVFFILLINTINGVLNIRPELVRSARIMGATSWQVTIKVVVPAVLSWIFAGLRLSVSMAFLSAVVAEFVGSTAGLGYQLHMASTYFDTTGVFVWMVVLGLLSVTLNVTIGWLERRVLRWRPPVALT
ncbi:MAG: ABC transporter permease [Armatimonadota bacterium]|nr:ABC transporter permease [Armatimonadota bacterium]